MNIAILNLTAGGMSGGYKTYLRNIVPRMSASPNVKKILLAVPSTVDTDNWFAERMNNIEMTKCMPHNYYKYDDMELFRRVELLKPDVIFVPVERYYKFGNIPTINMIQNMEMISFPFYGNPLTEKIKNALRLIHARKAALKADRIIALSNSSRSLLIDRWQLDPHKIGVVYHGVEIPSTESAKEPNVLKDVAGGKFIFTAGSIRPSRGIDDILSAYKILRSQRYPLPTLIIAGEAIESMKQYKNRLMREIMGMKLQEKIIFTGCLNENEMSWCYRNCAMFIMSSRIESFGIIAVEAMANGALCIAANNPCLPEIFEDSAKYYSPRNAEELSVRIKEALELSEQERRMAAERSITLSRKYSWDVCAEKTIREFEKALK